MLDALRKVVECELPLATGLQHWRQRETPSQKKKKKKKKKKMLTISWPDRKASSLRVEGPKKMFVDDC